MRYNRDNWLICIIVTCTFYIIDLLIYIFSITSVLFGRIMKRKNICVKCTKQYASNVGQDHPINTESRINMMTSSNGNIFRVTGPLCGEFTGPGEIPTQRLVTWCFDVFFDLRLNKRLSKQPRGWWFETPSWSLWRHCNEDTLLPESLYLRFWIPIYAGICISYLMNLLARQIHFKYP